METETGFLNSGAGTGMAGMAAAIPMPRLVWHCHTNKLQQTTNFTYFKSAVFP